MATNPKEIVREYQSRKKEKYQWLIHYQAIAEYFMTRKADFTVNFQPGTFLNRDLYDSTGPKCVTTSSGALIGMLWPEQGQNFRIKPPRNIPDTKETKDFYDEASYRLHCAFNDPAAGFMLALGEYMRDAVTFGTSGIALFDGGNETDFLFQPWDVKRMVISEGPNGLVNYAAYEREETVQQTVLEFGPENVSEKTRNAYAAKDYDSKVTILHVIRPRYERDPDQRNVFNMPVASVYIEISGADKLLKESGFPEMPAFVNRLYKNTRETYGRSMAMDGLPDALELNALREAEIIATEKTLDPPLGVLDDGKLGADTVDTSAGAINVINVTGRVGGNNQPIFPLYTIGDLKNVKDRIEELKQSISDHFMIDRLLDLNNETEMTLGEAQMRNKLRAMVLGSLFSRQITEVFSPAIKRGFNMMLRKGKMGVMPGSEDHRKSIMFGYPILVIPPVIADAIRNGEDVFEIEYMTPAMRMMQSETADGIINTWKFMNDIAQTQPEIYDNIDEDLSITTIAPLLGAPREIIRDKETIGKIRAARAQQQEQDKKFQMQIEAAKAAGHLGKLMPNAGAPGTQNQELSAPLQA